MNISAPIAKSTSFIPRIGTNELVDCDWSTCVVGSRGGEMGKKDDWGPEKHMLEMLTDAVKWLFLLFLFIWIGRSAEYTTWADSNGIYIFCFPALSRGLSTQNVHNVCVYVNKWIIKKFNPS